MNAVEQGLAIHEGVKAVFMARGGTQEQWARVAANPRKFNHAWRRTLGLPGDDTPPPPEWLNTDPQTGEFLRIDAERGQHHQTRRDNQASTEAPLQHVACIDCANWREGCKAGFFPSLPAEPVHLCKRFSTTT